MLILLAQPGGAAVLLTGGTQGPTGPSGLVPTPSMSITGTGTTLLFTGPENWFNLDVTAAGFVQPIPALLVDGQIMGFRDLTATKGAAWGTHQAAVSVSGGMEIFNPSTNKYVTGTLNFPMFAGASYRFQYVASLNLLAPA